MRLGSLLSDPNPTQGSFVISPHARAALEQELLPQLEESVTSIESVQGLCSMAITALNQAFKAKDPTYTRLISHKTIDQSDEQFQSDLVAALRVWGQGMMEALAEENAEEMPTPMATPVEAMPMAAGPLDDSFGMRLAARQELVWVSRPRSGLEMVKVSVPKRPRKVYTLLRETDPRRKPRLPIRVNLGGEAWLDGEGSNWKWNAGVLHYGGASRKPVWLLLEY